MTHDTAKYFTDVVTTNDKGASQSDTPCRMDLIPPSSLLEISTVLAQGATKYGEWNWLGIPTEEHLNHALTHIYGWLAGDRTEHHLANAACRILFALHTNMTYDTGDR